MKRFCFLVVLMLLSSSAHAGFDFILGRWTSHPHRGLAALPFVVLRLGFDLRRQSRRDRYDDDDRIDAIAGEAQPRRQPLRLRRRPRSRPGRCRRRAAGRLQAGRFRHPDCCCPAASAAAMRRRCRPPRHRPPAAGCKTGRAVRAAGADAAVSHEAEDELADTPIGDWQTEGKGAVRIGKCGNALCGYVLNCVLERQGRGRPDQHEAEERPAVDRQRLQPCQRRHLLRHHDLKGANTLRVEACALGRFYCSGNNWSRITGQAESLMSSRQTLAEPRS